MLIDYLPEYLQKLQELKKICDSQQVEIDALKARAADVFKQRFIDTATWGLALWEEIYAIETDESKPLDQRRSMIKAKRRGAATVTVEQIKNIAAAFLNGQVDVRENFASYSIDITFTDYQGVPPNRDDLTAVLRDLIPAHLEINYILEYLLWSEFNAKQWTWDEIDAMDITWAELEVYK